VRGERGGRTSAKVLIKRISLEGLSQQDTEYRSGSETYLKEKRIVKTGMRTVEGAEFPV